VPQRRVVVTTPEGLHARPAAMFARIAAAAGGRITVGRPGGEEVDVLSILRVLGLGIAAGDEIVIRCDDPDVEPALDELVVVATSPEH